MHIKIREMSESIVRNYHPVSFAGIIIVQLILRRRSYAAGSHFIDRRRLLLLLGKRDSPPVETSPIESSSMAKRFHQHTQFILGNVRWHETEFHHQLSTTYFSFHIYFFRFCCLHVTDHTDTYRFFSHTMSWAL